MSRNSRATGGSSSRGAPGARGPGQFNTPHAIATDSRGRLFVADRGNRRIQVFDQEGNFLDEWKQFGRPSGILITADDTIYVADVQDKQGITYGSAKDGVVRGTVCGTLPESMAIGSTDLCTLAKPRPGAS